MTSINKKTLHEMFMNGYLFLEKEYEYINKLNVFPVPDGDTGSNMLTTLKGALDEITDYQESSLYEFTKKFSRALLMNAHGNSGVILSQILKGFFEPIQEDSSTITTAMLIDSFLSAQSIAYKVVSKPKEGTILTVIRVIAEYLNNKREQYKTIEEVFTDVISVGTDAVNDTPNILPVLKRANVVDSGAYGLVTIFKGMYDSLINITENKTKTFRKPEEDTKSVTYEKFGINSDFVTDSEDGYGYCCEFILEIGAELDEDTETKKSAFDPEKLSDELNSIGNSLVIVYDNLFCKVHLHTFQPYKFLEIGQRYGEFHKVKIDNMTLQRNKNKGKDLLSSEQAKQEQEKNKQENKKNTLPEVIATVPSKEIGDLLRTDFNVQYTIDRSCNQNPSVKDFLEVIKKANSTHIALVIDNKDCYMSAQEASKIAYEQNKITVAIIYAQDIIQSICAILSFSKFEHFNDVIKKMTKAVKKTISAKISQSQKKTNIDHLNVKKNDYMVIYEAKIMYNDKDFFIAAKFAIDLILRKKKRGSSNTLYLVIGKDVDEQSVQKIQKYINDRHFQAEIIFGQQDIYQLFIGAY